LEYRNRRIVPNENTRICNVLFAKKDFFVEDGILKLHQNAIPSIYGFKGNIKQTFITVTENNILPGCARPDYRIHKHPNVVYENIGHDCLKIIDVRGGFNDDDKEAQLKYQQDIDEIFCDGLDPEDLMQTTAIYIKKVSHDDGIYNKEYDITELNTEYTQSNIEETRHLNTPPSETYNPRVSNQMYNNQTDIPIPSMLPTGVDLGKAVKYKYNNTNAHSNRTKKMVKKTNIPKRNKKSTPLLINSRSRSEFKHNLSSKFVKKLRILQQKNIRLLSRVKTLMTRKQDMQDFQIKYLQLKDKVLEAEEQLLTNGIDTSEYSVFRMANEDNDNCDREPARDIKYDVLLEYRLDRENQIPINNSTPDVIHLDRSSSLESLTGNENDMS